MFVTPFLKVFSPTYFTFTFQLNTGHHREGPILCLVASNEPFCLACILCLLPSLLITNTMALVASTVACAIACCIFFCFFFFLAFAFSTFYFWHDMLLISYDINSLSSFVCTYCMLVRIFSYILCTIHIYMGTLWMGS